MAASDPVPTGAERQRSARGEARRAAVIAAALRVVGARGIGGLTHRAVAVEAGIRPSLTTYYFPTIDSLLEATLETFVQQEAQRLEDAVGYLRDPAADIRREEALATAFAAMTVTPGEQIAQFELYLEAARRPSLASVARRSLALYAELARTALERLGSDRADEGGYALVALLDGFALRRIVEPVDAFDAAVVLPAVLTLLEAYAPAER